MPLRARPTPRSGRSASHWEWPCSSRYSGRTVAPSPRTATTPACARPSSLARPSWPWGHCPLSGSHAPLGAPWPHPRSPALRTRCGSAKDAGAQSREVRGTGVVGAGRGGLWAFEPRPLFAVAVVGPRQDQARQRGPGKVIPDLCPATGSLGMQAVDCGGCLVLRRCIVSSVSRPAAGPNSRSSRATGSTAAQAQASPGLRSIHPHHISGRDTTATLTTADALLAVEGVGVEEWYDSSCYIQG